MKPVAIPALNPAVTQLDFFVARGICKQFGAVRALTGATLTACCGEIHALLGANGAGKSTLSKIIAGQIVADAGELLCQGQPLTLRTPRDALAAGLVIVMQETSLAPHLSVLENIFLPELARPGWLSYRRLRERAQDILTELAAQSLLTLETEVRHLSAAQKQLVEIAKALAFDARLIIFDEPTASLSPGEVDHLFDVMVALRARGRTLLFVSHRLEEVMRISDRVTVMRDGTTVAAGLATASLTQRDIIRLMAGRDLDAVQRAAANLTTEGATPIALAVQDVAAPPLVHSVSLQVRAGEILGLGGLVGAGRSEAVEAIFGTRPRSQGNVRVYGQEIPPQQPFAAIRAGMGLVSEDRRRQNIVPDFTVQENLLLAHLGAHTGLTRAYGQHASAIAALLQQLDLPVQRLLDDSMLNLSGGMQQKIIIARWLLIQPKVLILDEPTKGVDIQTRHAIYALLRQIARQGVAIVVISSDFEELLDLAQRIVVVSDGHTTVDMPAAMLNPATLTLLAAPRASRARSTQLLQALAQDYGAASFWVLIEDEHLICLDTAPANPQALLGFGIGAVQTCASSAIAQALAQRTPGFVTEADGSRATLLVPVHNQRQRAAGWIGLTLRAGQRLPSVQEIQKRVEDFHG